MILIYQKNKPNKHQKHILINWFGLYYQLNIEIGNKINNENQDI